MSLRQMNLYTSVIVIKAADQFWHKLYIQQRVEADSKTLVNLNFEQNWHQRPIQGMC